MAYTIYEIDETVKLLDQLIAKNKSFSKQGTKIKTDFESLKAKMVVTTGDGYVATAEPQLREKLGELYASVAGNFTAPSPSQLENKDAILQRFDTEFKNLKAKNEAAYLKQAKEQNIPFTLKTYAEFVAE